MESNAGCDRGRAGLKRGGRRQSVYASHDRPSLQQRKLLPLVVSVIHHARPALAPSRDKAGLYNSYVVTRLWTNLILSANNGR